MANSRFMRDARHCIERVRGHSLTVEERRELAIELAGLMLNEASRIQTRSEKQMQEQLSRMMHDPKGKAFATAMTDECFRSNNPFRVADQLVYLIQMFGIPKFLLFNKKVALKLFQWFGRPFAFLTVPLVKSILRQETSAVILPGEPKQLSKHMLTRRDEGVRVNLNHLGEAILGEEEAKRRLNIYLQDLANPEVEYISVKVSTICSQINLLGWEESLSILIPRLKQLYRAAQQNLYKLPNGKVVPKFVNLDMEEYRDLFITVELFRRVLDDAEFFSHSAGIVLQSYLPDAFHIQQELTLWAIKRVVGGGAPIKVRIVKGANLAMEQVEASLRGWVQAPYAYKSEVDANFKRMMMYGCQPENAHAVHLGIASHNLFDIAYGMILRSEKNLKTVGFEMLEGMADPIRRVVQALTGDMLLYCPCAVKEEFQNAVAYLVRRLDENTAPENFLRHAFDMRPGSKEWQVQSELFSNACYAVNTVSAKPRRQQNRFQEPHERAFDAPFANEPDTDWTLSQNRKWAEAITREWSVKQINDIPLVLGSNTIYTKKMEVGESPSLPTKKLYRYSQASNEELDMALKTSERGFEKWSKMPLQARLLVLDQVGYLLNMRRGDLIGAMMADTGKTIQEADVEVSEAVDFAAYYRRNVEEYHYMEDIEWSAKGPVLVAPPWNFPCSIPAGGILAALSAGNSVIFKPAPESVLVGWQLVNVFWEAGIDKEVLQFFCCPDEPIGSRLIQDTRLKAVALTGGTNTAKLMLRLRPGIDLLAETGGKNSIIVTRMADRDLAIRDLIQSAFGHAGQKCSACSLGILEKEVYDDPHFIQQLRDAAASWAVGSPWNLSTRLNPLIRKPNPDLLRGITTLDEGEEWLLKPHQDQKNPNLWSPGIKLGVKPGSFMHQTELFGPVLGLMSAKDLDEAIMFANGTPYGLTAGIHSLDEREHCYWQSRIVAGNCYINRGITGAIVRRQPFGGCKESSFGSGAKAGGPNYVIQLMKVKQRWLPKEREPIKEAVLPLHRHVSKILTSDGAETWLASLGSYAFFYNHYFSKKHDPSQVVGQDNFLMYVPRERQVLRVQAEDSPLDIFRVIAAALTCQAPLEVSFSSLQSHLFLKREWLHSTNLITLTEESEQELILRIKEGNIKRIRLLSSPSFNLQQALAEKACNVIQAIALANGRLELLHCLREVSLSIDYHRYGYLGLHEVLSPYSCPSPCQNRDQCPCYEIKKN